MIYLLVAFWYLIGIISMVSAFIFIEGSFTVENLFASLVFGTLGPIATLLVLPPKFFDFVLYKRTKK